MDSWLEISSFFNTFKIALAKDCNLANIAPVALG